MARIEVRMPKMGESITEATIIAWTKEVGDKVELDETILEIATDKVDSEIPSPVEGILAEILFQPDDVVGVGSVIATITTEVASGVEVQALTTPPVAAVETVTSGIYESDKKRPVTNKDVEQAARPSSSIKFYSPLVRNIAAKEHVTIQELDAIRGTGRNDRVTKQDLLDYLASKNDRTSIATTPVQVSSPPMAQAPSVKKTKPAVSITGGDEIIEMDRMRQMIADHMVMSKQTSPHVTSFVEIDVTDIVEWRHSIKEGFKKQHGQSITFTPIFIDAVVKAIRDFPMINISVDGKRIIKKKDINVGMATALPSGNLIVPVIKNAEQLSLLGLIKQVNHLASAARSKKLKPSDTQGGTFTVTNVGTFGNVMGTPIINQPQVAILSTGAIRKKPAVVETAYGDLITVRQLMFLSLSYDHRVVDGMLGGSFLRRVGDYLEQFDTSITL